VIPFAALEPGADLGVLELTVSSAANERYWRAAGADHSLLRAGLLYPPIAANLTVMLFNQACPEPVIQTRQGLRVHRRVEAGVPLVTTGRITDCYEKRGRAYVDLEAVVTIADARAEAVWTSTVSFTPVATLNAP
jgi:hypothetical protein